MTAEEQKIRIGFLKRETWAIKTVEVWLESYTLTLRKKRLVKDAFRQDVAQDALEVLLDTPVLENPDIDSLKGRILKIASNICVNYHRKFRENDQLPEEYILEGSADLDPRKIYEEKEKNWLFQRVFELIGDGCRTIWHLNFNERLRYKVIAEKLQISETAVRKRFFDCRKKAIGIYNRLV